MPRIQVGDISLNYIEHGSGDNVILNDGFFDCFVQRAGVADARCATISCDVEAEFF